MKNGSTDESMGALFLDLRYVYRRSYMFHNVARHKCRNCRRLSVSSVLVPALLSVACHCVMLTIRALAVSFWLHSSGQAKASGVFFLSLQNGIIWQLFLLHRADYRGQLFMLPDQVHIKHRLFVSLILIW